MSPSCFRSFVVLLLDCFFNSLDDEELMFAFTADMNSLQSVYEDVRLGDLHELILSPSFACLFSKFNEFVEKISNENPTFFLWVSYLRMTELLFLFVHATRTSNWNLHLQTIKDMLPFFFAYDRGHYSRWLPIYWLEMCNLKNSHPDIYQEIKEGGKWTVQRTSQPSVSLACDQAIEQTLNRESKTKVEWLDLL